MKLLSNILNGLENPNQLHEQLLAEYSHLISASTSWRETVINKYPMISKSDKEKLIESHNKVVNNLLAVLLDGIRYVKNKYGI